MKARLRLLALIATWLSLGVCLLAFAASRHWLGELASHFPLHLAVTGVCLSVLLLGLGAPSSALLAVVVVAISVWRIATAPAPAVAADSGHNVSRALGIVLWNIENRGTNVEHVLDWIAGLDPPPQVIALLETGTRVERAIAARKWPWRVAVAASRSDNFGLLVLVRDLAASTRQIAHRHNRIPSAHVTLCPASQQPLELLVTHPPPPMSFALNRDRDRQLAEIAARIAALGPNAILVGDLNVTPWSPVFRRVLERAELMAASAHRLPRQTWAPHGVPMWLGIPIDHMLFKGQITLLEHQLGPRLGSDHRAVMARFALPATACAPSALVKECCSSGLQSLP